MYYDYRPELKNDLMPKGIYTKKKTRKKCIKVLIRVRMGDFWFFFFVLFSLFNMY